MLPTAAQELAEEYDKELKVILYWLSVLEPCVNKYDLCLGHTDEQVWVSFKELIGAKNRQLNTTAEVGSDFNLLIGTFSHVFVGTLRRIWNVSLRDTN